jgi:signal peptidase I
MTAKIEKKITGYKVLTADSAQSAATPVAEPDKMHEAVPRPEMLFGSTYKVKSGGMEHALYITINDVVLNEGTEHESRHPYEIFINSKNMEQFQWILALTRVVSAVFRKGGDVAFLVDELKAVFNPAGGYWKRGGKYMPSLVAEIGYVLEEHLKRIGVIQEEELSDHVKAILEEKRAEFEAKHGESTGYPDNATVCAKCGTKAVIRMDGCEVCLSCGDSRCH